MKISLFEIPRTLKEFAGSHDSLSKGCFGDSTFDSSASVD